MLGDDFLFKKFVDNAQQCFAFTPPAKFPAHNLNFHWRWRWWDQIQATFYNLFYFTLSDESTMYHCPVFSDHWYRTKIQQLSQIFETSFEIFRRMLMYENTISKRFSFFWPLKWNKNRTIRPKSKTKLIKPRISSSFGITCRDTIKKQIRTSYSHKNRII